MHRKVALSAALLLLAFCCPAFGQSARYIRAGNPSNTSASSQPGFALMGGGKDLDEAFRWLCSRAGGGDLLVLRASGDDDYNPYIQKLCRLNSVATLILPSRAAAEDPSAAKTIREASALFIAGGDQANYVNFWMDTPVQSALNEAIARGIPIGGTSAGLAVLGEFAYSAQGDKPDDPNLDAATALANPTGPRMTLVQGFLSIPILRGIITDSHFAKRNRMGRLLVFLARLNQPDAKPTRSVKGIGIDEGCAVLLEPDGTARVIGRGRGAWFVDPIRDSSYADGRPTHIAPVTVHRVAPSHSFNIASWSGDAVSYSLSAETLQVTSTQPSGSVY